jgi:hypothetical protein
MKIMHFKNTLHVYTDADEIKAFLTAERIAFSVYGDTIDILDVSPDMDWESLLVGQDALILYPCGAWEVVSQEYVDEYLA